VLLDMWGHLHPLNDHFNQILRGTSYKKRSFDEKKEHAITKFWRNLELNITKLFDFTLEDIRTDSEKTMPSDGTVHPLTNSTINYLVQLTKDDGIQPTYKSIGSQYLPENQSLKHYITAMINTLRENLDKKALRGDSIPGLASIFKLNNYYFIDKKVQSTDIAKEIGKDAKQYTALVEQEKRNYFQIWQRAKE